MPLTQDSYLAPGDLVMVVPVIELMLAIDDSVDNWGCEGGNYDYDLEMYVECECDGLICLQRKKLAECGSAFIDSIVEDGIQAPIVVTMNGNRWVLGNGNHRISAMMKYDPYGSLPVLFTPGGDYMRTDISEDWQKPDSYS